MSRLTLRSRMAVVMAFIVSRYSDVPLAIFPLAPIHDITVSQPTKY